MQFLEVPLGGGRERERYIENLKGLWDFFYSLFGNFECVVKCDSDQVFAKSKTDLLCCQVSKLYVSQKACLLRLKMFIFVREKQNLSFRTAQRNFFKQSGDDSPPSPSSSQGESIRSPCPLPPRISPAPKRPPPQRSLLAIGTTGPLRG